MKKIFYLLVSLPGVLFGCHSNNEPSRVVSSSDSLNQIIKPVEADTMVVKNPAADLSLFLRKYYQNDIDKNLLDSGSRKFIYGKYDLNRDGEKETFIGLTGSYFCGSGGCTALLLDSKGNLLNKFTVVQYPFKISSVTTNKWNDLVVESGGKQRVLKFNGITYPSNPSVQSEFDGNLVAEGQVLDIPGNLDQWQKF